MKKKLAILLTGVLLMTSVLMGCGNDTADGDSGSTTDEAADDVEKDDTADAEEDEADEEARAAASGESVTISLLSWYTDEQLGELITAFEEENPNIKIDLQYVPAVQQYIDKFSVLVASGQMTDMFYTAAENKQEVIEQQLAEDISDMDVFSRIAPSAAATYGHDGEVYAYSPDAWIGGIFYNKALFEEAGIDAEPATWGKFVEICEKLKEAGVEPYLDDAENVHNLAQDLYQSTVVSQERDVDEQINNGESTYTEKYTDPLTTWYEDLVESGLYSQIGLGLNNDQVVDMFANGEVAMFHGGPWSITTIEEKNPDLDYDIFGLSDKDGNQVLPGAVNVGLSISTDTSYKEECRAFIEFMSRDENILTWQQVTGNIIIVEGIDYSLGTVFEKFKDDAVDGNFYLPQIAWKNSSGIYKEFLAGIQDTLTGADTIENIPVRLDEKQAELSQ